MSSFQFRLQLQNLKIELNALSSKAKITDQLVPYLESIVTVEGENVLCSLDTLTRVERRVTDALRALGEANAAICDAIDLTGKTFMPPTRQHPLPIEGSASPAALKFRSPETSAPIRGVLPVLPVVCSRNSPLEEDARDDEKIDVCGAAESANSALAQVEGTAQVPEPAQEIVEIRHEAAGDSAKVAPAQTSDPAKAAEVLKTTENRVPTSLRSAFLNKLAKNTDDFDEFALPDSPKPSQRSASVPKTTSQPTASQVNSARSVGAPSATQLPESANSAAAGGARRLNERSDRPDAKGSSEQASANGTPGPMTRPTDEGLPQGSRRPSIRVAALEDSPVPSSRAGKDRSMRGGKCSSRAVPGYRPTTLDSVRVPPLWCYTSAELTHVDRKTGRLYIVLMEDNDLRRDMVDRVNVAYDFAELPSAESLSPMNTMVIAPFEDHMYRATFVRHVNADSVEVFFLDFGNTSIVPKQDIRLVSTGKATKKVLKTCQLAIPCQLEHPQFLEALDAQGKDRLLLVLLTSSCQQQEAGVTMTVYTIKDIISEDDAVEFAQLPKNEMLQRSDASSAEDDECDPVVVVSQAVNPARIFIVGEAGAAERLDLEAKIGDLPLPNCDPEVELRPDHYVVYRSQRAQISVKDGKRVGLCLIDSGKLVQDVELSECQRAPLIAFLTPPLAVNVALAKCSFDDITWSGSDSSALQDLLSGRKYILRFPDPGNLHSVFLIDHSTRKNVVKQLAKKGLCRIAKC